MKKFISRFLFILILSVVIMPNVKADTVNDYIANGTYTINAVPPTDIMTAYSTFDDLGNHLSIQADTCNDTYTRCTLTHTLNLGTEMSPNIQQTSQEVDIIYNYDETTKNIVDSLVLTDLPDETYTISDAEFINYALYGDNETIFNYSQKIKQRIGYKNFYFVIGAGSMPGLSESVMADMKFGYNNTIYFIKPMVELTMSKIVYVPSDTANEDILNAVRARFNAVGAGATVTEHGTLNEYLSAYYGNEYDQYAAYNHPSVAGKTRVQYISEKITNLTNDELLGFTASSTGMIYRVEANGHTHDFVVAKDTSKIQNITYKTNDVGSNIEISTDSKQVPFDALIRVAKLNSGATYEHIMEVLNAENSETYDISLFANSTNSNITTLDDGTFKVRIPVPASLVGKNLIVYYVNNNDEVEEHAVTPVSEGGKDYAEFTTNHFSVYTLAEGTATGTSTSTAPATGDNVGVYMILFLAVLSSLVGVTVYTKKKNK